MPRIQKYKRTPVLPLTIIFLIMGSLFVIWFFQQRGYPQQIIIAGSGFAADYTYNPRPTHIEELGDRSVGYMHEISIFPSDVSTIDVDIIITTDSGVTMSWLRILIRPVDDPTGVAHTEVYAKYQPTGTVQVIVSGTVPNTYGDYYWDIAVTSPERGTTGHGGYHAMGLRGSNPLLPLDEGAATLVEVSSSTERISGKDFTPPADAQLFEAQTFNFYYDSSSPTIYIKGFNHISNVRIFYQLEVKYRKDTSEVELFSHDFNADDWNNYYDTTSRTYKRRIPEFSKPYDLAPQPDVKEIFDGETGWPAGELDLYLKATVTTYYAAGSKTVTAEMSVQLTYVEPAGIPLDPFGVSLAIIVLGLIYRKRRQKQ